MNYYLALLTRWSEEYQEEVRIYRLVIADSEEHAYELTNERYSETDFVVEITETIIF